MVTFGVFSVFINKLLWGGMHPQTSPNRPKTVNKCSKHAKNRKPDRRFKTGFFLRFRAFLFKKPTNRG